MGAEPPKYPPQMLFELGRLQVFCYPTDEEFLNNIIPKAVFWQDTASRNVYGPFTSIYEATLHYTHFVNLQKSSKNKDLADPKMGDVIFVDFAGKRKVIYDLPE